MNCTVSVDNDGFEYTDIYSETTTIRWDELNEVFVYSNYEGKEDFLYLAIIGKNNKCLIPFKADGFEDLISEMQKRLRGFNNDALIEATTLMSGSLTIWKR